MIIKKFARQVDPDPAIKSLNPDLYQQQCFFRIKVSKGYAEVMFSLRFKFS